VDDIREQTFVLYYFSEGGISYGDVEEMEATERAWQLKRLLKQRKNEVDEMKKAQKRPRRR
jgi:hypothetical protein